MKETTNEIIDELEDLSVEDTMDNIIKESLRVMEIYAKEILTWAKAGVGDSEEMRTNLHHLTVIGSYVERVQRLQLKSITKIELSAPLGDIIY